MPYGCVCDGGAALMGSYEVIAISAGTGLVSGALHVLMGPDHLATVLPLAAQARDNAFRIGFAWGAGHSIGVLVLGASVILFGKAIDLPGWSAMFERAIGVLLIGLGLRTLLRARWLVIHEHDHKHADEEGHRHPHVHFGDVTIGHAHHRRSHQHQRHPHSAMGFGILHGFAGTSHVLGVLPVVVLEPVLAAAYLLAFLSGSAVAMGVFAGAVGRFLGQAQARWVLNLTGVVAVFVGGVWVARTFI